MITRLTASIAIAEGDDSKGPSPKIGIVFGKDATLLVDVSNDKSRLEEAFRYVEEVKLPPVHFIALTHFHDDHIANLIYVSEDIVLLASKNTARYLNRPCQLVSQDEKLDLGGLSVSLILVPSLHAKGCLDVLVGDYLFVGDSLYYRESGSSYYYNAQIAFEMMKKMAAIPYRYAISAHEGKLRSKADVDLFLSKLAHEGLQKIED
jgi:glyoxylase-like metal-dependent hydrolase (beta-lactamase superfamily II)